MSNEVIKPINKALNQFSFESLKQKKTRKPYGTNSRKLSVTILMEAPTNGTLKNPSRLDGEKANCQPPKIPVISKIVHT
jgi:hypothetical protein